MPLDRADPLRVAIISGEASGDRLGAALMRALAAEHPDIVFEGVGGRCMRRAGLWPWFDVAELSVMGFAEVIPHLPRLVGRLHEAAARVEATAPDVLVTVDSPGFNLHLARRVRRASPRIPIVHYVAPSVWAWASWRAGRLAGIVDRVLALLPFEPMHFAAAGVPCEFVGHPVIETPRPGPAEIAALRAEAGASSAPLLVMAPGSRSGEVRRMFPIMRETVRLLRRRVPNLRLLVPLAAPVEGEVRAAAEYLDPEPLFLPASSEDARRQAAFAAADAALVTSGSIVLEMACAGTPMVSAYQTSALTAALIRALARVDSANLVNLVAGEHIVPEFLQENCVPGAMAFVLERLLAGRAHGRRQRQAFRRVLAELGGEWEVPPSRRAARAVLETVRCAPQRFSIST